MAQNPFDELVGTLPPSRAAQAPIINPFDVVVRDQQTTTDTAIRANLRAAGQTTPDTRAKALQLKAQTGLPTDLIERNLSDIVRETQQAQSGPLMQDAPGLARQLAASPDFAAVAHDDLEPLTTLERSLDIGRNLLGAVAAVGPRLNAGFFGLTRAAGDVTGFTWLSALGERGRTDALAYADWFRGAQPRAGFVEKAIYSGVESVGIAIPALAAGALAGPGAMFGVIGATTGGESYGAARTQGMPVVPALGLGLSQAAIEIATEKIPAMRMLKDIAKKTPIIKSILRQVLPELGGEQAATFLQDLNEWAVLPANKDKTLGDFARERPSAAAQTAIATVTAVGLQTTLTRGTAHVLEQLGAVASESKTLKRAPQMVEAMVAQETVDSPLETLFVPLEAITAHWRTQGLDPVAEAARLTGNPQALANALQTGEDLAVPIAKYMTQIAGTPANAWWAAHARFIQTLPTEAEADTADVADTAAKGVESSSFIRNNVEPENEADTEAAPELQISEPPVEIDADTRAVVAAELAADPAHQARAFLVEGTKPDGTPLADGVVPFKLSEAALVSEFGPAIVEALPVGVLAEDGISPTIAAELLGFPDAATLVETLRTTPAFVDAVEQRAAASSAPAPGSPETVAALTREADTLGAELDALQGSAAMLRTQASQRVSGTPLKDLKPAVWTAAATRAGEAALEAAGKQQPAEVRTRKGQQFLNTELARAAVIARGEVEQAIKGWKPIFRQKAIDSGRYNVDLVQAARALLSQFGIGKPATGQAALAYLDQIRTYDPELYADLEPAIDVAKQSGRPVRDLTLDEFRALRDAVDSLWHTARRSQQVVVAGRKVNLVEARETLETRLRTFDAPHALRGYQQALTPWEKTQLGLLGWRASLRRVEHWVDAIDGGNPDGVFRRILWTPISQAASRYRIAKKTAIEQYLGVVRTVERSLTATPIAAPELGYTFNGTIELLHALTHTGNSSNLSKLLRGRQWGSEGPDGVLDTSRWDAFLKRAHKQGMLTKDHWDYVQGVWDLLEELKPQAQQTHHDLYGYYFSEITAVPVETPFGSYRGGYMPAMVDYDVDSDASQRADKEALEGTPTSFVFPSTGRGFMKGRIEAYARPLVLDLRQVPMHLDKVLRFIHLEPAVKNVARLVRDRSFRRTLDGVDPTVGGEMLIPWLQRTARQTVSIPSQGWGGRLFDTVARTLRSRTGLNLMTANVINTMQQIPGLSLASVRVPKVALARAFFTYMRQPRKMAAAIAEQSEFMRTLTTTQMMEVGQTIDELLLQPSQYQKAGNLAQKYGYFLQTATQGFVNMIAWHGAYETAIDAGVTDRDAVQQADAVVRMTQGTFNPEDLSAFETGTALQRSLTLFSSYFNMQANLLGTETAIAGQQDGIRAQGARFTRAWLFGFLVPALIWELMSNSLRGTEIEDEDEDGQILDDWLGWALGSVQRAGTALVPGGQLINYGLGKTFGTARPYEERISISPILGQLEQAGRAPSSITRAITGDGSAKMAIRDTLTAIGLVTRFPAGALGKPLGYLADVAQDEVEPEGAADIARGLVTGR